MVDRSILDSKPFRALGFRGANLPPANPVVLFDGDSKAGEASLTMRWVACKYGLDIDFSGQTGNSGGLGVGGSQSFELATDARIARSLAAVKAYVDAGRVVDYSMRMFTNDASTTPEGSLANMRKFHDQVVRAGGCRYFIIWSAEPINSGTSNAKATALSRLLEQYAAENSHDTIFINSTALLLDPDPANIGGRMTPYTHSAASNAPLGSMLRDTAHKGAMGMYRAHWAAVEPMRHIYRRKQPPLLTRSDAYGVNSLRGNMGGTTRRCVAMGGDVAGINKASGWTGTITGLGPADSVLTGYLSGSASLAFSTSTVTIDRDDLPISRGTWPAIRLTVSGSTDGTNPAIGAFVQFSQFFQTLTPNLPAGSKVRAGCLVNFNGLQGLMGIAAGGVNWGASVLGTNNTSSSVSPNAEVITEPLSGPFWYETGNLTPPNNLDLAAAYSTLYFGGTTPLAGSIDILISGMLHNVSDLPASA